MTKIINIKLIFLLCLIILNTNIKAQNINALTIAYDITYPYKIPSLNIKYFKQCIMYASGSNILYKYLTEQNDIGISITNDCNETTYCSNYYGGDMLMKVPKDGVRSAFKLEPPNIRITEETKIILGLKCKKVISEQKNVTGTMLKNIYYIYDNVDSIYCSTVSIAGLGGQMFGCEPINKSNSVLLGAEIDMGRGCIQVWSAKLIGSESVNPSIFNIPQDMLVMTYDEYNDKVRTDRSFRKKITKAALSDKTAEFNKQVWTDLIKDIGQSIVPTLQGTMAMENFNKNPTSGNLNSLVEIIKNNTTLSPEDAAKKNSEILENSIANPPNTSEQLATTGTNANSTNENATSQQRAQCAKETEDKWQKTPEYINFKNGIAPTMINGEKAKLKLVQMMLANCGRLMSPEDKKNDEELVTRLQSEIATMEKQWNNSIKVGK